MSREGGAVPEPLGLSLRRLLLVAVFLLGADLVTKILINTHLPLYGPPVTILGDYLRWFHVKNHGSAFSLFQGGRYFFIIFSLVSIAVIVLLARTPRYRTPPFAVGLGLILGGALGNLVDRVAYGAVTDWIDVGFGTSRWPTFNVADMGVTLGVLLLGLFLIRSPDAGADRSADDADSS